MKGSLVRFTFHLVPFALFVSAARAQRARDTVFIIPGSHLDLGFTAPIGQVQQQRIQILDHAIQVAEQTPGFVWFEEGGWSVEAWLDHYRDNPAQVARLRALVRARRIGVGATLLSPHAAAFPEALRLLTLHLDRVQRELGRRPTVAVINDVPAVPEALVDALAAAGIRYLLMGPNLVFSSPLPATVTREPFYWESAHGARVLVAVDPEGYTSALMHWLLPPDCVRFLDPQHFPATISDDSILTIGVGGQLARRTSAPLTIIQHALDNGEPYCVANLGAAAQRWNARKSATTLVPALPEVYFQHLEATRGRLLAVRRGEWGGDWDLLRASEPVWSWRLRHAIHALKPTTPRDLLVAAVMATDHNVGLGPRWMDGLPAAAARAHIAGVADLYRRVVSGALGPAGIAALPPAVPRAPAAAWPDTWRRIVGDRAGVARVRAGPAFIYPFVEANAAVAPMPLDVTADARRLVIHTTIDRLLLERQLGTRYQAVIEVTLHGPLSSITLEPDHDGPSGATPWLLGTPSQRVVAPQGVRVSGPGWVIHAHGPLLIGWTLVGDPVIPTITRLQVLAVVHAVAGEVSGKQQLRLPFADMYPGEPAAPVFDLELIRANPRTP